MTDEKTAAPPAIAPANVAPRPDRRDTTVPPPPTPGQSESLRRQPADAPAPQPSSADGTQGTTSTLSAMKKAVRKVGVVAGGEHPVDTSAEGVPAVPNAAQQAAAQRAPEPNGTAYGETRRFTVSASAPGQAAPAGAAASGSAAGAPPAQQTAAPATAAPAAVDASVSARRVRLVVSRVNPWSVMKMAFLLSIALGIVTVVATAVTWSVLNGLHVFSQLDELIKSVVGDTAEVNVLQYVAFSRAMSLSVLIAVVNIFLMTALATVGAFLYNIASALVGGVHVTLTDD